MSQDQKKKQSRENQWLAVLGDIWKSIVKPLSQPSYVFFFVLSVVVGGIAVVVAILKALTGHCYEKSVTACFLGNAAVFQAAVSFFAALGCVACVRVIIVVDKFKHMRAVSVLGLFVTAGLAGMSLFLFEELPVWTSRLVVIGFVVALLQHWIANFDENDYSESGPDEWMLGGDTTADLQGKADGFEI